jgi:hypothetical protein
MGPANEESVKPMAALAATIWGITYACRETLPCAYSPGAMRIICFASRTDHAIEGLEINSRIRHETFSRISLRARFQALEFPARVIVPVRH